MSSSAQHCRRVVTFLEKPECLTFLFPPFFGWAKVHLASMYSLAIPQMLLELASLNLLAKISANLGLHERGMCLIVGMWQVIISLNNTFTHSFSEVEKETFNCKDSTASKAASSTFVGVGLLEVEVSGVVSDKFKFVHVVDEPKGRWVNVFGFTS